jgi:choline dehydrogenase-like flavoprotein
MARAQPKQSVCVVESGEERWPGEFPSTTWNILSQLRFSGCFSVPWLKDFTFGFGKTNGLYQWIVGKASSVFVSYGIYLPSHRCKHVLTTTVLGGTSLLNANVFLRSDPRVFQSSAWPSELRQDRCLDECKSFNSACIPLTC